MQATIPATPLHRFASSNAPFTPHDGEPFTPSTMTPQPVTDEPDAIQPSLNPLSQAEFSNNRTTLAEVIDVAAALVTDLKEFNEERWSIRYPRAQVEAPVIARSSTNLAPQRPTHLHRSFTTQVQHSRSVSQDADQLPILSLPIGKDLTAIGPTSLHAALNRMTQGEVSKRFADRLQKEIKRLADLKTRVEDKASKILITGDLNAGKSTFVNALLRRDLLPVDQQPSTTVFCEVLDADCFNAGKEEVHAIKEGHRASYSPESPETYTRFDLEQLEQVACAEETDFALLKVFANDARASSTVDSLSQQPQGKDYFDLPAKANTSSEESFLRNGLVSISLIDAPGLNRDNISTTENFTRESELDVVVFVVSAENHFTLSAKEFLWAARDKPYIFVVVNKFAAIKDKARCKRLVLDQIKQLSPLTYDNRSELVHFVDAASDKSEDVDFEELEKALRSFLLVKRATSKLLPAKHYLEKLLQDVGAVDEFNMSLAQAQFDTAQAELEQIQPVYERLCKQKDQVADAVAKVEESHVEAIKSAVWNRLDKALSDINKGQLVPFSADPLSPAGESNLFLPPTELPAYPGFLNIWQWASDVKSAFLQSLEGEIRKAEEAARSATIQGHDEILVKLAERFLPTVDKKQLDEASKDASGPVFKPEVMFASRRRNLATNQRRRGVGAVGLGAGQFGKVEVSILDLVDLDRINPFKGTDKMLTEEAEAAGALSVVSLGVGAVTMFGSRAVGVRGFVEAIAKTADILGSPHARKWAGPVIGVLTIGLAVYVIIDLPRAVPRNIGRKLHASLLAAAQEGEARPHTFVSKQSDRISTTSRSVIRLCGYELHKRFAEALEKSEEELRAVQASQAEAKGAMTWLDGHLQSVMRQEEIVESVDLHEA